MKIDYTVNSAGHASELFMRIPGDKRRRIIDVAVKEFAGYGFASANVNRIAEEAGISVGALYKYFPTKEDLFMYIVEVAAAGISILITAFWGGDQIGSLESTRWWMVGIFALCVLFLKKLNWNPIAVMLSAGVLRVLLAVLGI